ncbi:ABC transporter permease [Nonomuraea pusilla]|uniref:ABC-2 type transport system permease protein n=1 Tax=Nonomuraea pusilla TaxID=46177 RepID=A0A1H8JBN6_9ACTN|nr:ABC-2 family transporter protein [Nonomuraea pusilla]SEN77825.1 ABC-2 type transport system permease protein [Nonomuraea pusilla]
MAEILRSLRLYFLLQRASARGAMQYRLNTVIGVISGAIWQGTGFAFVWVVMHTFPSLAGWGLAEIAFLYGLRLTAHALAMIPLMSVNDVQWIVRNGEFDRFLLRPLNPLVQLMGNRMGIAQFGDLLAGVALLAVAGRNAQVQWDVWLVAFCAAAIVGGALIEAAFFLALCSLSLRMVDTFALRVFIDDVFSKFGSYPMKIFGGTVEWLLTFVLPVAFVAYVPSSVVLGKLDSPWAPAAPLLGVALISLAYLVWRRQLAHYQSVGH